MVDNRSVQVELDIFSGRPNPRWLFPVEPLRALSNLADQPQDIAAPIIPGLGYRGFILSNPEGSRQLPADIRVYNGTISVLIDNRETVIRDDIGLEEALLEDAIRLGFGPVIERSRQYELPRPQYQTEAKPLF